MLAWTRNYKHGDQGIEADVGKGMIAGMPTLDQNLACSGKCQRACSVLVQVVTAEDHRKNTGIVLVLKGAIALVSSLQP